MRLGGNISVWGGHVAGIVDTLTVAGMELPGIEPAPKITVSCANAEFDYAKQRETTRNDLQIRRRCLWYQHARRLCCRSRWQHSGHDHTAVTHGRPLSCGHTMSSRAGQRGRV